MKFNIKKSLLWAALGGILLFSAPAVSAQQLDVDAINWDDQGHTLDPFEWVEVRAGSMPVVISVPHGGNFHDEQIADRDCKDVGRVVKGIDRRTIPTGLAMEKAFEEINGTKPYMVIAKLSRRKVDQNREINLATCGDELGEIAWHNYHNALDAAIKDAIDKFGYVFFVDLHGHGHKIQRLELGYALSAKQLRDLKSGKNPKLFESSSLANLVNVSKKDVSYEELLFGENSIGAQMEKQGIASTPSFEDPHPVGKQPFFGGGHITRKFTDAKYEKSFGLQIECFFKGVRDTDESREKFARAFVNSYNHFLKSFL